MVCLEDEDLFCLVPLSSTADRIVDANPQFASKYEGNACLSFKAGNKSNIPGKLVSIGCLVALNDVLLPDDGFSQFQCFFYLSMSGELMLEDATTGHHTRLDWFDEYGKQEEYSLQGDPRRRAIPRSQTKKIEIYFAKDTGFSFVWRHTRTEAAQESLGEELADIARASYKPGRGMTLTTLRDPNFPPTAYGERTMYTPKVPKKFDGQPLRQIHVYKKIGAGANGTVSKAAELATGSLLAVKECIPLQGPG